MTVSEFHGPTYEAAAAKRRLEIFYNSSEYRSLEYMVSQCNARFRDLKPQIKLTALYLLQTGGLDSITDLWRMFYRRPVPTISQFLTERYIGSNAPALYPQWRRDLLEFFKPGSTKNELVLGGCHQRGYEILMIDGTTKLVEDIEVGDLVMGPDGEARTVWSLVRGRDRMVRVTPKGGDAVVVNAKHVFPTQRYVERSRQKNRVRQRTMIHLQEETRAEQLTLHHKVQYGSVDFPERRQSLDPYLVGLCLGDGSLGRTIYLSLVDNRVIDWVQSYVKSIGGFCRVRWTRSNCFVVGLTGLDPVTRKLTENPVRRGLEAAGLAHKTSYNKFIPDCYKRASRAQRLKLLAGLIDSDGDYRPNDNTFRFASVSKQLADDAQWIAQSLGFKIGRELRLPSKTGFANGKPCHVITICGKLSEIPTLSSNKQGKDAHKDVSRRTVRSLEWLPEDDYYGFNVDRDHLYLGGDFMIHHNCIGAGKSFVSRLGHFYNLFKVTSLLQPQLTLGVTIDTLLVLALFSVTVDKAALSLTLPFQSLLNASQDFIQVRKKVDFNDFADSDVTPFVFHDSKIEFPNNILINVGSNASHAIAFSMFGAMLDEAEFGLKGIDSTMELYMQLKERVRSRFLGSRFTFLSLVSSARYSTGVIANYTRGLDVDDPFTTKLGYPIWEIKSFDSYIDGHFYVLRGTSMQPSRVLDAEYDDIEAGTYKTPSNCEVIKVPNTYRKDFDGRIEEALRNLAGVQTIGEEKIFPSTDLLEDLDLTPEFSIESNLGEKRELVDKFIDGVFENTIAGKRFIRYPTASRYLHLDLATQNKSQAGMTCVHKEIGEDGEEWIIVDFAVWITSKTQIDLNAIKRCVIALGQTCNVHFAVVSSDQFQSTAIRQELELLNIAESVELLSVDRTVNPYMTAGALVTQGRVKMGRATKMKEQMAAVAADDSRSAKKIYSSIKKDLLDSLVGAVTSAVNNVRDAPTHSYVAFKKVRDSRSYMEQMVSL